MATLIKDNGTEETLTPANGKAFTLPELQKAVEGYIEPVYLRDGRIALVNEEALLKKEFADRANPKASALILEESNVALYKGTIFGNVLVLTRKEMGEES